MLRGRDEDDRAFRARARTKGALVVAPRTRRTTGSIHENYVPRLRIYPHALRQQNAYYSPQKKALLFGYFPTTAKDGRNTPGTTVFTCLSHDIIAHETTHALLDGVHPRFNEPVNEDVLAFHEAFADIVALFQHFSYPGVLRDQIARTRGDLARQSVLGQLAQQFALASGRGDALRSYLGKERERQMGAGQARSDRARGRPPSRTIAAPSWWPPCSARSRRSTRRAPATCSASPPKAPACCARATSIPTSSTASPRRRSAARDRALQMCIRAIDYCPPVGITFGAYLRAIVTADHDMNPVDRENWRLAFIESFREWGISPRGTRSMAEDSLLWPTEQEVVDEQVKGKRRRRTREVDQKHVTYADAFDGYATRQRNAAATP